MFGKYFRKIFIVTNGQVPNWLDTSNERIEVITHEEIFPNKSHLPTFNSNAIEMHVHRIPGLSQHFALFNDDFMLGRETTIEDFIKNDTSIIYMEKRTAKCKTLCTNFKEEYEPFDFNGTCHEDCKLPNTYSKTILNANRVLNDTYG